MKCFKTEAKICLVEIKKERSGFINNKKTWYSGPKGHRFHDYILVMSKTVEIMKSYLWDSSEISGQIINNSEVKQWGLCRLSSLIDRRLILQMESGVLPTFLLWIRGFGDINLLPDNHSLLARNFNSFNRETDILVKLIALNLLIIRCGLTCQLSDISNILWWYFCL